MAKHPSRNGSTVVEELDLDLDVSPTTPKQKIHVETIAAPRFQVAQFTIRGIAPLVIHRFSEKTKQQMKMKMEQGKSSSSKKNRDARLTDDSYQESRYIAKDGWDGFHAASIRNAMISACRLVNFKMTLADRKSVV